MVCFPHILLPLPLDGHGLDGGLPGGRGRGRVGRRPKDAGGQACAWGGCVQHMLKHPLHGPLSRRLLRLLLLAGDSGQVGKVLCCGYGRHGWRLLLHLFRFVRFLLARFGERTRDLRGHGRRVPAPRGRVVARLNPARIDNGFTERHAWSERPV